MIFSLPSSRVPRFSYFCPTCGRVWAEVLTGHRGEFMVTNRSCAEHTTHAYDNIPGSLLQPFQWWDSLFETQFATALRTLPTDWLAHEFAVHMAAAEKEMQDDNT